MEINRQPVRSMADFARIVSAARTGDALAFYGYDPSVGQRGFVLATVDTTMKATAFWWWTTRRRSAGRSG